MDWWGSHIWLRLVRQNLLACHTQAILSRVATGYINFLFITQVTGHLSTLQQIRQALCHREPTIRTHQARIFRAVHRNTVGSRTVCTCIAFCNTFWVTPSSLHDNVREVPQLTWLLALHTGQRDTLLTQTPRALFYFSLKRRKHNNYSGKVLINEFYCNLLFCGHCSEFQHER